ncbi:zinc finger, CCHC-type containing protein [Tanacetum coccineum]
MLAYILTPTLIPNSIDRLIWKSLDGMDNEFYVASVWDNIRPRGTSFDGHDVVWFTYCIPRHAFNLWLFIKRKLKTQDLLRQWDAISNTNLNLFQCPLLLKNQKRSQDRIIEVIKCTVLLKLVTCKFKSTTNVKAFLHLLKLPDSLLQSPH